MLLCIECDENVINLICFSYNCYQHTPSGLLGKVL